MDPQEYFGIQAASPADALTLAAGSSKTKEVVLILDSGVHIDSVGLRSKTTALCSAVSIGSVKMVKFLVEKGAGVDVLGDNDMTPLMHACSRGKKIGFEMSLLLLNAGADVNAVRQSDDQTPLKFSIHGVNPDLIRLLLERGAEVDGPEGTSQTALMLAARNDFVDALPILIEFGADPQLKCGLKWAEGRTALGLAELEKRKKSIAYLKSLPNNVG
jgi:ankyrin repeat protein